jgi:hypothetical protein
MDNIPMSKAEYLDDAYPLGGKVAISDKGIIGKVVAYNYGTFAIIVENKDGERQEIVVDPHCDVYPPYGFVRYATGKANNG